MSQLLGAHRRVRALLAAGYPLDDVAARLDWKAEWVEALVESPDAFTRQASEIVAATYAPLEMKPGPDLAAGRAARRAGCAPGLAWDEDPHEANHWDKPEGEPQGVRRLSGRMG